MNVTKKLPSWLIDGVVAALLVVIALVVERQTQGRLFTSQIVLSVGGGSFVLLRLGAGFARAGRTLGCLFAFAITWVLPCSAALFLSVNPDTQSMLRDSGPFFMLLGFFLILIMLITFERVRIEDQARFALAKGEEA